MLKNMLIITIVAAAMAGCSSKPELDAVEPLLKEGWALCPGVRIFDIKKTNGQEKGNGYEMGVSYKLEVTQTEQLCTDVDMLNALRHVIKADKNKAEYTLKAGEILSVNTSYLLQKSEKGWIVKE